ncbi:hypothetical protein U5817_24890 [Aromatoleum evansii]|uniref:Uncharacterized protein n=1 Tax=Aromatoleum evansii TaxID=59406 RepID=A0ABZ1AKJ8_AROEV|nr:hypothetical protein U5817_24890 [Aromatoleum evansii]
MSHKLSLAIQSDEVGESVRARYTMTSSILRAMLYSSNRNMITALGGPEKITLEQLARVYQEGTGDFGICFEYALHDSIRARHSSIYPIIEDVLHSFCKIKGNPESILFGIEKNGNLNVVETARNSLTDDARVLAGKVGKPPFLKHRVAVLERAFRSVKHRDRLPQSISGLWQADLFLGSPTAEQWVGTTLKVNREELKQAPGLRVGIFPSKTKEGPKRDEAKNLIICPLPYRSDFMVLFGASFQIAKQLMHANANMPKAPALVYEDDLAVAEWLSARRKFPVMAILEALHPLMQPGLIKADQSAESVAANNVNAFAPMPLID